MKLKNTQIEKSNFQNSHEKVNVLSSIYFGIVKFERKKYEFEIYT